MSIRTKIVSLVAGAVALGGFVAVAPLPQTAVVAEATPVSRVYNDKHSTTSITIYADKDGKGRFDVLKPGESSLKDWKVKGAESFKLKAGCKASAEVGLRKGESGKKKHFTYYWNRNQAKSVAYNFPSVYLGKSIIIEARCQENWKRPRV